MFKYILLLSAVLALTQCQPLADTEQEGRAADYNEYDRFYFYRPPNPGSNPGGEGGNPDPNWPSFEEKFKSKKGSIGEAIDRIGEAARLTIKEEKDAAKKAFQSVGAAAGQTAAAGFNVLKSKLGMLFILPKLAINAIALKPTEKTTEAPGNTTTPKSTEAPANATTEASATTTTEAPATTAKSNEPPKEDNKNKELDQAVTNAQSKLEEKEAAAKPFNAAVEKAEEKLAAAENKLQTEVDALEAAKTAGTADLSTLQNNVIVAAGEVSKESKNKANEEEKAKQPNKDVADAKTAVEAAIAARDKANPKAK